MLFLTARDAAGIFKASIGRRYDERHVLSRVHTYGHTLPRELFRSIHPAFVPSPSPSGRHTAPLEGLIDRKHTTPRDGSAPLPLGPTPLVKRGRGRPKGSRNQRKTTIGPKKGSETNGTTKQHTPITAPMASDGVESAEVSPVCLTQWCSCSCSRSRWGVGPPST